jgi:Spy/CpxP family protein refolding chaperone
MTRTSKTLAGFVALCVTAGAVPAGAQTPPPAGRQNLQGRQGQRAGRPVPRPVPPPLAGEMDQQQLQSHLDAFALVEAERQLQLTAEQYPTFVARLRRLQDTRRRHLGERRRIMAELRGLVGGNAPGGDDRIQQQLKALADSAQRLAGDLAKAYADLDEGLTPWQRGRFRLFEEQLERRKIDLLGKIGGAGPANQGRRGGGG